MEFWSLGFWPFGIVSNFGFRPARQSTFRLLRLEALIRLSGGSHPRSCQSRQGRRVFGFRSCRELSRGPLLGTFLIPVLVVDDYASKVEVTGWDLIYQSELKNS